jgi:hypothetical protein
LEFLLEKKGSKTFKLFILKKIWFVCFPPIYAISGIKESIFWKKVEKMVGNRQTSKFFWKGDVHWPKVYAGPAVFFFNAVKNFLIFDIWQNNFFQTDISSVHYRLFLFWLSIAVENLKTLMFVLLTGATML